MVLKEWVPETPTQSIYAVYEENTSWSLAQLNEKMAEFTRETLIEGWNIWTRKKRKLRESSCLPGKRRYIYVPEQSYLVWFFPTHSFWNRK